MHKKFSKKWSFQFRWAFVIMLIQISIVRPDLNAQTIAPYAINNGGGFSSSIEWSMGESVSIAHFISASYSLNTGLLQPSTTIVTSINEFGPAVFGNEIFIGPNPAINMLQFRANLSQTGKMTIQLIDTKSVILQTVESGSMVNSYIKELQLENYPAGLFYVRVLFKPFNGVAKSGIYKIIKL
jgi:hypothetical protein